MVYYREGALDRVIDGNEGALSLVFPPGEEMSNRLLSFQEIVARYRKGENLFDITIEKWRGIKNSLHVSEELAELAPIIKSARTGGAFCLEYQENCLICPLERWCKDPQGTYQTIIKLMYLYASGGQKELKSHTIKHIERFLEELEEYKDECRRRLH